MYGSTMSSITFPVALPEDLYKEIRTAAKKTGLSMADVLRQSSKMGMPALLQQFGAEPLTNVEPLPDKVLEKLYQQRDDEAGDPEGLRKLMASQPLAE
jgi:hypothetical protein